MPRQPRKSWRSLGFTKKKIELQNGVYVEIQGYCLETIKHVEIKQ